MYSYSKSSKEKLSTCHQDLQAIFNVVIQITDCRITAGIRTTEEQQALFAKGRSVPGNIVTNADGVVNKSNHQAPEGESVSYATDAVPYPTMWSDKEKLMELGGIVKGVAAVLKQYGAIEHDLEWGGDWNWVDLPHFQLKK